MLDYMTPAMLFINILVFCVILPLIVAFHDGAELIPPVPLRRKAITLMARTSGLPLWSVVFWDHLGCFLYQSVVPGCVPSRRLP